MEKKTVTVRATVESAVPDRAQFKPYATTLTFGGKLEIELEVPEDEVIDTKGGKTVVTAKGFTALLETYLIELSKLNVRMNKQQL